MPNHSSGRRTLIVCVVVVLVMAIAAITISWFLLDKQQQQSPRGSSQFVDVDGDGQGTHNEQIAAPEGYDEFVLNRSAEKASGWTAWRLSQAIDGEVFVVSPEVRQQIPDYYWIATYGPNCVLIFTEDGHSVSSITGVLMSRYDVNFSIVIMDANIAYVRELATSPKTDCR